MLYAVGIVEIRSIAKGIEACDDALKTANIRLVSAHPSCPGKYEIVMTGNLSDVQMSLDKIKETYSQYVIDAVLLGRIDETVVRALMGSQEGKAEGALGVVETFSAASAIKAADTAVKTAKVEIYDLRVSRGMGGKGMVLITGEVSDVTASVEAGAQYAKDQGLFVSSTVMAAPHQEIWEYL